MARRVAIETGKSPSGATWTRRPGPDVDALVRNGYGHHLEGNLAVAITAYRKAISLDPGRFDVWYVLGVAESDAGRHGDAIPCLRRALALRPRHARAQFQLGKALFAGGEVDAALHFLRAAARHGDLELRHEALARIARYIPGSPLANNATVLKARRRWAEIEAERHVGERLHPRRRDPGPLRIGYVSSFFGSRNWMKPVWGVVNHHDRKRLALHLFSDGRPPTHSAGYRPHPTDRIHDIRGLSNRNVAAAIADIGIDVLIDLNGYSAQERLGVFMLRPAPVGIGWFNMYATTGIDTFDYIVGDDVVMPRTEERYYAERVIRVAGSYLAFSVLYPVPQVSPPPCSRGDPFTLGSFASQYKLADEVIAAWAEILNRAPRARLLLRNRALSEACNRKALLERFRRYGPAADRVLLRGPAEHRAFLAAYADIDVALDTFPYNGGTTTTEALWQGVPVLTFQGDRWASRTSASLLQAAGLGEWCLPDLRAYVERAVSLANAPATCRELAQLRSEMRRRLRHSAVCDTAGLCRSLESLYRQVSRHAEA